MDDRICCSIVEFGHIRPKTLTPIGWWRKAREEHNGPLFDDLDTIKDCLTDPVDDYTAPYCFSSGEWDHKIYNFEGQSREEAIRFCRHPHLTGTIACEEDRRLLGEGGFWYGGEYAAYYPFKDKFADTYMKPWQSREEITRLIKLAEEQEKDCICKQLRTNDSQYYDADGPFAKDVAKISEWILQTPLSEEWVFQTPLSEEWVFQAI